jgi:hypothetical protein
MFDNSRDSNLSYRKLYKQTATAYQNVARMSYWTDSTYPRGYLLSPLRPAADFFARVDFELPDDLLLPPDFLLALRLRVAAAFLAESERDAFFAAADFV